MLVQFSCVESWSKENPRILARRKVREIVDEAVGFLVTAAQPKLHLSPVELVNLIEFNAGNYEFCGMLLLVVLDQLRIIGSYLHNWNAHLRSMPIDLGGIVFSDERCVTTHPIYIIRFG